jgi:hypothetical protein
VNCGTCKHWRVADEDHGDIEAPYDPDTFEPMVTEFAVRRCHNPALLFHERPVERNGFAVLDGSGYWAALWTAEDFGCVRFEKA